MNGLTAVLAQISEKYNTIDINAPERVKAAQSAYKSIQRLWGGHTHEDVLDKRILQGYDVDYIKMISAALEAVGSLDLSKVDGVEFMDKPIYELPDFMARAFLVRAYLNSYASNSRTIRAEHVDMIADYLGGESD